jgi:hypothetical protein
VVAHQIFERVGECVALVHDLDRVYHPSSFAAWRGQVLNGTSKPGKIDVVAPLPGRPSVTLSRWRFDGEIAAFGTAAGHRIVVGRWPTSPFGPISDVMVETPDGTRLLIAPTEEVAGFIASTYRFDAVDVTSVEVVRCPGRLHVAAGPLRSDLSIGRRGWLGLLLRAVPRRVATAPAWAAVIDPLTRAVLPGVRTRGSAGSGRREWYGAWDLHPLVSVTASWQGTDLGAMADVFPPVRFGFGSTPRRPSIVRLTTTVQLSHPDQPSRK